MPTAEEAQQTADAAKEQSREVVQHAGDQARQVTDVARQQAGEVARQATDRGRAVLRDAGQELQTHADSQAERASDALRDVSRQLRMMADGTTEGGGVVDLARHAAQRTEKLARRLDEGGSRGLLDDVLSFARRRPGVFLLGASAGGFVVGRLLHNADLGQVKDAASSGSDPGQAEGTQLGAGTAASPSLPSGDVSATLREGVGRGGSVTGMTPR